jgi:hypothetical protein
MLDKLIVLVEEPSMEMALEQLLPRMLAGASFRSSASNARMTC